MLTRAQKKEIVIKLTEELKSAKGVVLSDFTGLKTKESQELRKTLRENQVSYQVVKITLLKKALQRAGAKTVKLDIHTPLAVSFSQDDEVISAKLVNAFAKTHQNLKILGGFLNHQYMDVVAVKQLALLPGKQELLGQLVSVVAGPLQGLVTVLSGNMRALLNVLSAKAKLGERTAA